MSVDKSAPNEIVIVRRRGGGEEDGHHGGAWKIAYADFMTALMAFFLVMWLVNAADKKVLTQVATYFNPLRMSERVTAEKGLDELVEGMESQKSGAADEKRSDGTNKTEAAAKSAAEPEEKDEKEKKEDEEKSEKGKSGDTKNETTPGGKTHFTEMELFNDPYGVLEKLAAAASAGSRQTEGEGAGPGKGMELEKFRDPFDAEFFRRSKSKVVSPSIRSTEAEAASEVSGEKSEPSGKEITKDAPSAAPVAKGEPSASTVENPEVKQPQPAPEKVQEVRDVARDIGDALSDLDAKERPSFKVEATSEGILISLTDDYDFEMFDLSSAKPNGNLVVAMKRIGTVLTKRPGEIVVRGHTDARPFKKGTSDNWRLSTQRALVARYMLVAGGIVESRFVKVEGYAATRPFDKANPMADQNRRIEILISSEAK